MVLLSFFGFLDTDTWQRRSERRWDSTPEEVLRAVNDYLIQHLQCKIRQHRLGFQLVSITQGTRSTIRVLLSGLKLFYRVMKQHGYYSSANPLVDLVSAFYQVMEEHIEDTDEYPRLPEVSGVERPRHKQRLSESYFKLDGAEVWIVTKDLLPGC